MKCLSYFLNGSVQPSSKTLAAAGIAASVASSSLEKAEAATAGSKEKKKPDLGDIICYVFIGILGLYLIACLYDTVSKKCSKKPSADNGTSTTSEGTPRFNTAELPTFNTDDVSSDIESITSRKSSDTETDSQPR